MSLFYHNVPFISHVTTKQFRYREHGVSKISELIPFEKLRFKREMKLKRLAKNGKVWVNYTFVHFGHS